MEDNEGGEKKTRLTCLPAPFVRRKGREEVALERPAQRIKYTRLKSGTSRDLDGRAQLDRWTLQNLRLELVYSRGLLPQILLPTCRVRNMNPASLVSRFPQELIDMVVSSNKTETATLRSCALVCRAFLRSSQTHIFSHIDLNWIPSESNSCQRLQQILQESPHLRPYAQSLKVVGDASVTADGPGPSVSSLIAVLSMLYGLTSFTLDARDRDFQWMDMVKELRMAICGLCQRSSLVKLGLLHLGKFAHLDEFASLVASPQLSEIALEYIELPPVTGADTVAYSKPPLTKGVFHLEGSTLRDVIRWLVESDLSHLRTLLTFWAPEITCDVQQLLNSSSGNLKEMRLIMNHLPLSYTLNLALPHSTTLCDMGLGVATTIQDLNTVIAWMAELLQPPQCPSSLTEIVLNIGLIGGMDAFFSLPRAEWTPLARTLSAEQFPLLRTFKLIIDPGGPGFDDQMKVIIDDAKMGLGELAVRGAFKYGTKFIDTRASV
ncbi:hypothetical protein B0H17DRAFT_1268933 [Mycena rosella]|uniref:F-box domain-containing protein n=1 Tax=Mycena rosella TaxID=1033263 RepID=A0AAD7G2K9_MYCRO|nr:hypothetical protein B0H17DRAFT_1268933 [Mycena rosella]